MIMKRKLSKQLERGILAKSYASLQWYKAAWTTQPVAETLKHHHRLKLHGSWQAPKCFTGTINPGVAHSNLRICKQGGTHYWASLTTCWEIYPSLSTLAEVISGEGMMGSLLISSARRESSEGRALRVAYSRYRAFPVGLNQLPPGAQT